MQQRDHRSVLASQGSSPSQWVNTEPDEGALPALLQRMEALLPADSLDAIWIFPTRRAASVESTVIVAACNAPDVDRRRVFTARFTVLRDRKGRPTVQDQLQEHATAPADALGRVVDGVVRRLGDDAAQPPRLEQIEGDIDRFDALIRDLGGTPAHRSAGNEGAESADGARGGDPARASDAPSPDPAPG